MWSGCRSRVLGKENGACARRASRGEEGNPVITLTRLDGHELVVNAELIELVEATPDTHLTLTDGRKLIVQESPDVVVSRVIAYRRAAYGPLRAIQLAS